MAKRTAKQVDNTRELLIDAAKKIAEAYAKLWQAVEEHDAKKVRTIGSGMIDLTGPALWTNDWDMDLRIKPTVAMAVIHFAQLHRATVTFAKVTKELADVEENEFTYQLEVFSSYVAQFRAAIAGM